MGVDELEARAEYARIVRRVDDSWMRWAVAEHKRQHEAAASRSRKR
jgi:hypothetical protein